MKHIKKNTIFFLKKVENNKNWGKNEKILEWGAGWSDKYLD